MFYSAAANGFERVNDAREDQRDRLLDQQNTEISLCRRRGTQRERQPCVTVDNTGSETLSVEATDLLVDNDYRTGYGTTVDGDGRPTSGARSDSRLPSPRPESARTGESRHRKRRRSHGGGELDGRHLRSEPHPIHRAMAIAASVAGVFTSSIGD